MITGTSVRAVFLFFATVSVGLMAGTFALYAHTVMPGLAKTDDRTFVTAFQAIDRAIINPWFIGLTFGAALGSTVLSAVAYAGKPGFAWVLVACLCYAIAVAVTFFVHVPLNNAIKAAGDIATSADAAQIRRQFDETRWVAWNLVRVVTSLAAFVCLLKARR